MFYPMAKIPYLIYLMCFNQSFRDIKFNYVSAKEIEDTNDSLKKKYSCRYDGISKNFVKLSIQYISFPLAYICNRIISTGTLTTRLKFSEIKSIFKKGDKSNLSNYRPISMLPSFSKIFEKPICNRLTRHMDSNCILVKE
jgi:hypothetical protein